MIKFVVGCPVCKDFFDVDFKSMTKSTAGKMGYTVCSCCNNIITFQCSDLREDREKEPLGALTQYKIISYPNSGEESSPNETRVMSSERAREIIAAANSKGVFCELKTEVELYG